MATYNNSIFIIFPTYFSQTIEYDFTITNRNRYKYVPVTLLKN